MDWNISKLDNSVLIDVVPYIGTWIETSLSIIVLHEWSRRTLYRYVDWNSAGGHKEKNKGVVPYIGTWIETSSFEESEATPGRTLYRYVDWNLE